MSPNRVALVVLGVALALVALLTWPEPESLSNERVDADVRQASPSRIEAELATPESSAFTKRETSTATPLQTTEVATEEFASDSESTVTIHARLVDRDRQPIEGGELIVPEFDLRAKSAVDGRVAVRVTQVEGGPPHSQDLELLIQARGYGATYTDYIHRGEPETWLGDVVLARSVLIRGRTIDTSGNPVAGALVVARPKLMMENEWARSYARHNGPYLNYVKPGATLRELAKDPHTAITDELGRFEIDDFSAPWAAVYAHAENSPWSFVSPLAVVSADAAVEVELVLELSTAEGSIRGRVEDEQGNALAGIQVDLRPEDTQAPRAPDSRRVTDGDGRFECWVPPGSAWTVEAFPTEWDMEPATLANVRAESGEITLVLKETEWFWARVRDERGVPLTGGRVTGIKADWYDDSEGRHLAPIQRLVSDLWDDGRARLRISKERFYLEAKVVGYESLVLGPFPANCRDIVEFELKTVPTIRGVITAAGKPVEGAEVALHARAPTGQEFTSRDWQGEGLPFSYDDSSYPFGSVVSSRSDGTFVIPVPKKTGNRSLPEQLVVLVEHLNFADTQLGPFSSDTLEELDELAFSLTTGGSVSGELKLKSSESTAGWSIVACNDSGRIVQKNVGDVGSFTLDRLRPGHWQLRAFHPSKPHRRGDELRDKQTRVLDVLVKEGLTARAKVEVETPRPVLFEGRLVIHDREPVQWTCDFQGAGGVRKVVTADAQGKFEAELIRPGEWTLTLRARDSELGMFTIHDSLYLAPGPVSWEHEFSLGTVILEPSKAEPPPEDARWVLLQRVTGHLEVHSMIRLIQLSESSRRLFPAGTLELVNSNVAGELLGAVSEQELVLNKDGELVIELR